MINFEEEGRTRKQINHWWLAVTLLFTISGCAITTPKISHVHVGHALTGWVDTPEQRGLFVTAERIGQEIARKSVDSFQVAREGDVAAVHRKLGEIEALLGDRRRQEPEEPGGYTFLNALQLAVDHMRFASESQDASQNIRQGVEKFVTNSEVVFARVEVLKTLVEVAGSETDPEALSDTLREIRIVAVENLEGEDVNDNGRIGDTPQEYGLRQLRRDMAATLDKEDPAYRAVEQRYLFGLIRLPDGTWSFKDPDTGAGGYGGY